MIGKCQNGIIVVGNSPDMVIMDVDIIIEDIINMDMVIMVGKHGDQLKHQHGHFLNTQPLGLTLLLVGKPVELLLINLGHLLLKLLLVLCLLQAQDLQLAIHPVTGRLLLNLQDLRSELIILFLKKMLLKLGLVVGVLALVQVLIWVTIGKP